MPGGDADADLPVGAPAILATPSPTLAARACLGSKRDADRSGNVGVHSRIDPMRGDTIKEDYLRTRGIRLL